MRHSPVLPAAWLPCSSVKAGLLWLSFAASRR
jgi:hypothetical protein